ncbi:MAG: class I SAM-dependent methyltransferase [Saprospiraceae bacterium]
MIADRYKNDSDPLLDLNELQLKTKQQIEDKIKSGHYTFEEKECAVCKGEDFQLLAEKDRYGLYCPVVICKDCGLVQINPRMTQQSYDEFYNTEYRNLYMGFERPKETYAATRYEAGKRIFDLLSNHYTPLKNPEDVFVLDIGCGIGAILKYFRDQGCKAKGIDLGSEYVKYGKETYNLDLSVAKLPDLKLDRKPDIIIYSHVFEHLLNLDEELKLIKNNLSENGILYLEVPGLKNPVGFNEGYKGDFLRYHQNAHTYAFTKNTLTNLLNQNGFRLIYGDEDVRSVFSVDETVERKTLKNDFDDTMAYLKKAESHRKWYPLTPYNLRHLPKIIRNKFSS